MSRRRFKALKFNVADRPRLSRMVQKELLRLGYKPIDTPECTYPYLYTTAKGLTRDTPLRQTFSALPSAVSTLDMLVDMEPRDMLSRDIVTVEVDLTEPGPHIYTLPDGRQLEIREL